MSNEAMTVSQLAAKYPVPCSTDSQQAWEVMTRGWRTANWLVVGRHFWWHTGANHALVRHYSERRLIRLINMTAENDKLQYHARCILLREEHRAAMISVFSDTTTPQTPSPASDSA